MSKDALAQRVLDRPERPDLRLRPPGHPRRPDRPPRAGDARVPRRLRPQADGDLAASCGHSYLTTSGNVSEHTTGTAVDIAAINGDPDPGPPGRGLDHRADDPAAADAAGHDEAAPDHLADDVPGRPTTRSRWPTTPTTSTSASGRSTAPTATAAKQVDAILKPEQWIKLIDRLDEIDNPTVARKPSQYAVEGRQARQPGPQGRVATPAYFGFVQWELPGRLGPDPGRYVVRRFAGDDAQQVVVIGGLAAPRRGALRRPRARARPSRTRRRSRSRARRWSRPGGWTDEASAEAWLAAAAGADAEATTGAALAVLNRALARAPDRRRGPVGGEVGAAHALVTRVGYGTGEQVAEGAWTAARELPAATRPRSRARPRCARRSASPRCSPARDAALACELLALRARAGPRPRPRRARPRSSSRRRSPRRCAELAGWRELDGMPARLDELRGARRRRSRAVAAAARAGGAGRAGARGRRARARAARGGAAGAHGRGAVLTNVNCGH